MPGIVNGKYTFQKATNGVPPSDFPALIKLGEIVFITLYNGKTIKGKRICVIATYVPVLLYIISGLLSSATNPIQTKKSFTIPCCCNKIIQLAVLTNKEVQKGSRTQIINRLLYFIGRVAS